jgi:hypothetical protein
VDRYLEFVASRARSNTLRAVAFDLKAFFTVIAKDPVEVTAADVFEFLAHQRGDRSVVRLTGKLPGRPWPVVCPPGRGERRPPQTTLAETQSPHQGEPWRTGHGPSRHLVGASVSSPKTPEERGMGDS